MILEYISLASDLAIIFLLFIQSYVLWRLKDPIISTAKNSEVYKKLFHIGDDGTKQSGSYPQELINAGIMNCNDPFNQSHIHVKGCL